MDISLHSSFLAHDDPEASLAFYRDVLGFEVLADVGQGSMRWITVKPKGDGPSVVLAPPAADPGITDQERQVIAEMMAKGTFGIITLATPDLDATFAELEAADVEIVQEPMQQPWGMRDCAVRDPGGNMVRINEVR